MCLCLEILGSLGENQKTPKSKMIICVMKRDIICQIAYMLMYKWGYDRLHSEELLSS